MTDENHNAGEHDHEADADLRALLDSTQAMRAGWQSIVDSSAKIKYQITAATVPTKKLIRIASSKTLPVFSQDAPESIAPIPMTAAPMMPTACRTRRNPRSALNRSSITLFMMRSSEQRTSIAPDAHKATLSGVINHG
jgi:hypothetical protein